MFRSTALLLFAGLFASAVNAAAGGGTLLSFPALMGAGLSPLAANATSTVGLLTGYFASVAGYREDMRKLRGEVGAAVSVTLAGETVVDLWGGDLDKVLDDVAGQAARLAPPAGHLLADLRPGPEIPRKPRFIGPNGA